MRLIYIILIFLLVSCASTTREFHEVLGAKGVGFYVDENEVEVLLDAKVGKLRIREVKMNSIACHSGYRHHIELDGEIGPDSTAAMRKLLRTIPKCKDGFGQVKGRTSVYMNSGGGYLKDGFEMGRLFRKYGYIRTVITGWQECASSCAIAFLGGSKRVMLRNAKLLFHAPYVKISDRSIDCSDNGQVEDLKKYYAFALDKEDGDFLHKRTMDYCSVSTGWVLNADGAKLFGITN